VTAAHPPGPPATASTGVRIAAGSAAAVLVLAIVAMIGVIAANGTPQRLLPVCAAYQVLEVVLITVCALSLVARYRASDSTIRAQIRWVTFAAAVAATGFVLPVAFFDEYIVVAFSLLFPSVPLACGAAILRHRLYDIDRLIGRTLSYAVVTGVVIGIYAVVVAALTTLLPSSSSLVVAAATLAAAAAVGPVLRRARVRVDRRFDRAHYDAQILVEDFALGLREQVDAGLTAARLLRVVGATMDPVALCLATPGRTVGT
jgi:hypothetical protein